MLPASLDQLTLSLSDIEKAYHRIKEHVVGTPLLESDELNALAGMRVLVKAETLQTTGSFKYRGACNRALQLTESERKRGIVAWSSGNHALAVAAVSKRLGISATIIMPEDAPKTKIEGARRYGAIVRFYDGKIEDREAIGAAIAESSGAVIVPPYDDRDVIAGQGTVGFEIAQQARELSARVDAVVTACSGGGLVAGTAIAIKGSSPATLVYAAEPTGFDELARSLNLGSVQTKDPAASSICDALQAMRPGRLTFPINRALLDGSLVVSDREVRNAMKIGYTHLRLIVEPSGAVPLAAILAGTIDASVNCVCIVLSGSNVDAPVFMDAVQGQ